MQQTAPEAVTIGKQIWMVKNLNVTTFNNGDPILQAKTDEQWRNANDAKQPACCLQDYHPANEARYGRLYNWYALNDLRGICPEGFHVPTEREWGELVDFTGEGSAGPKLKSQQGWRGHYNGNNQTGWTGLPGGAAASGGGFIFQHQWGFWWGSTIDKNDSVFTFVLMENSSYAGRYFYDKALGQSVRCIKNV